ncbi:tryptophan 7-halogenase [Microbulbifer flavimaris]|uniref:Tryptophan 7-halogenase n=1 Tax=Microbulbifer flavimaris TaxID=1781068 RepID=A0ABX4HZ64_9GAMM|nr:MULTISPECIES: tryptophan halogenase family protein [Microbulbifer]KUJ83291.1 tryptophan halogenase [Microbulbifer sp. ZGT114]PCO05442.1 tryptophan 7-halogenase [Microbulbifer flavimaris]
MKEKQTRVINIIGGGSAGWMTAIYLNRYFNRGKKNFSIRLIESPDVGIIGVGEATVHSIRFFFAAMGLDEAELMAETNATVKAGIMFRNWNKPQGSEPHEYFHPFDQQQPGGSVDISSAWFIANRDAWQRYDQAVSLNAHLIEEGRCPKTMSSPPFQAVTPYGYHLDAKLLARYLRKNAVEAGVEHVEASVSDVTVEGDRVLSVTTDRGEFTGDFFVDCSGFRGLLLEKLAEDNWHSFSDALPCDRAVAIQRPLPEGDGPKPYTVATALSNGWAWQIDLVNRQGSGYVYDSDRISPEEAERELREFLGPDSESLKCTHLEMKVGCRDRFWIGNCVAIGLSGGFIEPLESTGLHMIHLGVSLLATHLAAGEVPQALRDAYNEKMRGFYHDLKQFIVLHYCLSDRDDSDFWRGASATVEHCPWLQRQLEIWRHKICEYQDFAGSYSSIFTDSSYRYVLYGMQHKPDLEFVLSEEEQQGLFQRFEDMVRRAKVASMEHKAFLRTLPAEVRPEMIEVG